MQTKRKKLYDHLTKLTDKLFIIIEVLLIILRLCLKLLCNKKEELL